MPALVGDHVRGHPTLGPEDPLKTLALKEAYRLITVREGDRVERIPVMQAILRKVAVSAANGNVRAQQIYLGLVGGAEADRRAATMEAFRMAVQYKEHWGPILAHRARSGTTGPEPVPHPDEIIIDSKTLEVRIEGPVSQEQKDAQDFLHTQYLEYTNQLEKIEKQLVDDPNNLQLLKIKKTYADSLDWMAYDGLRRNTRKIVREKIMEKYKPDTNVEAEVIAEDGSVSPRSI